MKISIGKGPEITVRLVKQDEDLLPTLLASISHSKATQILVTGRAAYRTLWGQENNVISTIGKDWTIVKPSSQPTGDTIRQQMQYFALAIREDPKKQRICYGPAHPEDVKAHLFLTRETGDYTVAIYVLGLLYEPFKYWADLQSTMNGSGQAQGYLECIFSTDDNLILVDTQKKLQDALDNPVFLDRLTWEALDLLERYGAKWAQDEVKSYVKTVTVPPSQEYINHLKKLFSNEKQEKKWWRFWK